MCVHRRQAGVDQAVPGQARGRGAGSVRGGDRPPSAPAASGAQAGRDDSHLPQHDVHPLSRL
jgi:hypothetical protein